MTEHTPHDQPTQNTPLSVNLREAATIAVGCIEELTGKPCRGAIAVRPTDAGWTVEVEVVEDEKIPPTTEVLGLYEVEVGRDGTVTSYQRIRRYGRGEKDRTVDEVSTAEPEDTGDTPSR